MVTIEDVRDYLNPPPDTDSGVIQKYLDAAKSKARAAGIPDFKNNAQYDLFLCALTGCWYDNRNFGFIGSGNRGTSNAEANARSLINSFVLELRYASEDPVTEQDTLEQPEDTP